MGAFLDVLACTPENASTVWSTVVERGGLGPGEVLLAHGGAGGIGSMAIAVASRIGAVAATTSSRARQAETLGMGASLCVAYDGDAAGPESNGAWSDFRDVLRDTGVREWLEHQRPEAVRRAEHLHLRCKQLARGGADVRPHSGDAGGQGTPAVHSESFQGIPMPGISELLDLRPGAWASGGVLDRPSRRAGEGREGPLDGVSVVLDSIGGPYMQRNLDVLGTEGALVQVAFGQGAAAASLEHGEGGGSDGPTPVNLMRLMLKRLHWTGATLRSRSPADKGGIVRRALAAMHGPAMLCASALSRDRALAEGWGELDQSALATHLLAPGEGGAGSSASFRGRGELAMFQEVQAGSSRVGEGTVPLTARFRLEDVEEAHRHMAGKGSWGKAVLRVSDEAVERAAESLGLS